MNRLSEYKQKRIKKLWKEGYSINIICSKAHVSRTAVYRYSGHRVDRDKYNFLNKSWKPKYLRIRLDRYSREEDYK